MNEIKIVVTGTDKSGPAFAAAEKGAKDLTAAVDKIPGVTPALTELGHEASKAGDGLRGMGHEASQAGGGLRGMGNDADKAAAGLRDAAADARRLDLELEATRAEVRRLADEFASTGDQDLLSKFNKQSTYLAQIERVAKKTTREVATDVEQQVVATGERIAQTAAKDGAQAGEKLGLSLGEAAGPALIAALPVVVVAASAVGVAVGGAILTGVGLAGIGVGLAAELNDPAIQRAVTHLKSTVTAAAAGAAQPLVGPLAQNLGDLADEVDRLTPGLENAFSSLAPHVDRVFGGIEKSVDRVVPAVDRLITASGPLLDEFGRDLPEVADDVAQLLDNIASHSDVAIEGLDLLFGAVDAGVKTVNFLTSAFSNLYTASKWVIGQPLIDWMTGGAEHGILLARSVHQASNASEGLAAEQQALKAALEATTTAFEKQIKDMLGADNAAINYQQSIDDLTASVKENGRSLDITTQKGRNNKRMLDQLVGTIEANYEANIKAGMGADKAGQAFANQVGDLKKQMTALGFSKKDIDAYIAALDAMRLAAIRANAAIRDTGTGYTHHDSYATGGFRAAARGMFVPPSSPGTTLIGEPQTGGEWLIPARGISRDRAAGLIGGAARGYGLDVVGAGGRGSGAVAVAAPTQSGGSAEVRTTVDFSGDLDSAVATMFQRLIRERKITILSSAIVTGS